MNLHSSTVEDFEAEIVRQFGLTMSIEQLRRVGTQSFRNVANRVPVTSPTATQPTTPQATDLMSRYRACGTTAERIAFVRANRAEVRKYLRGEHGAPQPASEANGRAVAARAKSKIVRRKFV